MGGAGGLSEPLAAQFTVPQNKIMGKFPDTEQFRKIQQTQRLMQRQDGKLIWQKLPRDLGMYRLTVALTGVSLLYMASTMWTMAVPKKKE